jgi:hypothetical protein
VSKNKIQFCAHASTKADILLEENMCCTALSLESLPLLALILFVLLITELVSLASLPHHIDQRDLYLWFKIWQLFEECIFSLPKLLH